MTQLHKLVTESIYKNSEHTCIVFDLGLNDNSDDETSKDLFCELKLTYKQLTQQIQEFKDVFESLQICHEIVAVCLGDCLELPSVLIGLLSCQCGFHPISLDGMKYTEEAITSSGALWMIIHKNYLQVETYFYQRKKLKPLIKSLNGSEVFCDVFNKYHLKMMTLRTKVIVNQPPDLAYCITTSGTTGSPKVVKVTHSCIVPNIIQLRDIFSLGPGDKVLLTSPLTFDPSIVDIFCTLSSGACLVIVPPELKQKPEQFLKMTHCRQNITVMQATPSFIRLLRTSRLQETMLGPKSHLRILALGGEKFPEVLELTSWLHKENNTTKLYNLYGLTEMSCWATCHLVDINDFLSCKNPVPIGKPLDKTSIKLMEGDAKDEGEICIGSTERVCYIDNEVLVSTNEMVWRKTGDWGRLNSEGDIIYVQRMDEQVKRMGKRLNLTVIEMVLRSVPGVVNCSMQLVAQQLVAFIAIQTVQTMEKNETCSNIESLEQSAVDGNKDINWSKLKLVLIKTLEDKLPRHCMPDLFLKVKERLPVTANGKLDKRKLVKLAKKAEKTLDSTWPDNPLKTAQGLWQTVLKRKPINLSDNFISLGGDSLAAVTLISTVESMHGDKLPHLFDVLVSKDFGTFVDQLTEYLCQRALNPGLTLDYSKTTIYIHKEDNHKIELTFSNNEETNFLLRTKKCKTSHTSKQTKHFKQKTHGNSFIQKIVSRGNNPVTMMHSSTKASNICDNPGFMKDNSCKSSLHKNEIHLEIKWKYDTRKCVDASPLVVKYMDITLAFIGSHSGLFSAIDVNNGECLWTQQLPNRIESSACTDIKGILVVVGCYDGSIYVINSRTGHIEWTFATQEMVKCCPVLSLKTGHILCGSHDGHLYCLDVENKQCVWKQYLDGGSIFSSPAIDSKHGFVYAATLAGKVVALIQASGKIHWTVQLEKPVFSSLCMNGESVLAGCVSGQLYCLSLLGETIWTYKTEGPLFSTPVVSESSIYLGCHDTYLYCLSKDGQLQWRFKTNATVYSTAFLGSISRKFTSDNCTINVSTVANSPLGDIARPITASQGEGTADKTINHRPTTYNCFCHQNQILIAASSKGTVYLLCPVCGQFLTQTCLPGDIFSSPVQINNLVLVGSRDNFIYCLSIIQL